MRKITIEEVIAQVDSMYQNTFDRQDKVKWIDEVEEMIKQDIIDTHEDPPCPSTASSTLTTSLPR